MEQKIDKYTVRLASNFCLPANFYGNFITWIVGLEKQATLPLSSQILAYAKDKDGLEFPLAAINDKNKPVVFFEPQATLDLLRGEHYPGSALAESIVMHLPFEYNDLPMWMVGLAFSIFAKKVDLDNLPNFPAYPIDFSADVLFSLSAGDPLARPLKWPHGKSYVVTLTHDVDTSWVFNNKQWLDRFVSAEKRFSMRSAWYIVPFVVKNHNSVEGMEKLIKNGNEIGIHGYTHNPKLAYEPFETLVEKFTKAREMLSDFLEAPPGYRSPWHSRCSTMRRALKSTGFLYDSSSFTTDFQRNNKISNNGCCTLFPFISDKLVVLPSTLPQDTMHQMLDKTPEEYWNYIFDLVQIIKSWHGMVVITTHIQPHHSGNDEMLKGYEGFLEKISHDDEAWFALPREIAEYSKIF